MRSQTFEFLRFLWKKIPASKKIRFKQKIRTLDSLVNKSTGADRTLATEVVRVDLLNEYRDLIHSLIINFQEMNYRIQKLEENAQSEQNVTEKN